MTLDYKIKLTCEPETRIVLVLDNGKTTRGVFKRIEKNILWIKEDDVVASADDITRKAMLADYRASGFNIDGIVTWYYDHDTDLGL